MVANNQFNLGNIVANLEINPDGNLVMNQNANQNENPPEDNQNENPAVGETGPEAEVCRICHEAIYVERDKEEIIAPCRCQGSMAFMHIECFNEMRRNRCEICGFKYIARRAPFQQNLAFPQVAPAAQQNVMAVVLEDMMDNLDNAGIPLRRLINQTYQAMAFGRRAEVYFAVMSFIKVMILNGTTNLFRLLYASLLLAMMSFSMALIWPVAWGMYYSGKFKNWLVTRDYGRVVFFFLGGITVYGGTRLIESHN